MSDRAAERVIFKQLQAIVVDAFMRAKLRQYSGLISIKMASRWRRNRRPGRPSFSRPPARPP